MCVYGKITPPIYHSIKCHMFSDLCHRWPPVTKEVSQLLGCDTFPVTLSICDTSFVTCGHLWHIGQSKLRIWFVKTLSTQVSIPVVYWIQNRNTPPGSSVDLNSPHKPQIDGVAIWFLEGRVRRIAVKFERPASETRRLSKIGSWGRGKKGKVAAG